MPRGANADEPVYEVVWPLGRLTKEVLGGHRLPDPTGKKIGFVWDYVFRGDRMWDVIKEDLAERYDGLSFVDWEVFGNTHGHDEAQVVAALPELLREMEVDAVIAGVGA